MNTEIWPEKAILLMAAWLVSTVHLGAESAGLCITNPVVLPDGSGQFEVETPDADPYALLYSMDLSTWDYWKAISGSNHYVIQTPVPISEVGGTVFFRAGPVGEAIYRFSFLFQNGWNGPLVSGTPAVAWPQQIQDWHAQLDVVNSTYFPDAADVLFNGPLGSGIIDKPADYFGPDDEDDFSGFYFAHFTTPATPPGGIWPVEFGTELLVFNQPDPDAANRFVMIMPTFVINGGLLESVSWTYRDPSTGAVLGAAPSFITELEFQIYGSDFHQCGDQVNKIFNRDGLDPGDTSIVFDSPIVWDNLLVKIWYEDTNGNFFVLNYSFGNLYQVWGANSLILLGDCDPAAVGWTYLGSATTTATFSVAYDYYNIHVPKHNVLKADTVQGSNGAYYGTYITGNLSDFSNIGGPPDGMCATVGRGPVGFHTGGGFVIDAAGDGLTSITVHVCP